MASTSITSLKQLNTAIGTWFNTNIVQSRLNGDTTRQWSTTALGYQDTFVRAAMQAFIDRSQLNKDYNQKYAAQTPAAKQDVIFDRVEIGVLYSFLKCFVERNKGRLMFYRDDLSQKGARVMYNVRQSEDYFDSHQKQLSSGGST